MAKKGLFIIPKPAPLPPTGAPPMMGCCWNCEGTADGAPKPLMFVLPTLLPTPLKSPKLLPKLAGICIPPDDPGGIWKFPVGPPGGPIALGMNLCCGILEPWLKRAMMESLDIVGLSSPPAAAGAVVKSSKSWLLLVVLGVPFWLFDAVDAADDCGLFAPMKSSNSDAFESPAAEIQAYQMPFIKWYETLPPRHNRSFAIDDDLTVLLEVVSGCFCWLFKLKRSKSDSIESVLAVAVEAVTLGFPTALLEPLSLGLCLSLEIRL